MWQMERWGGSAIPAGVVTETLGAAGEAGAMWMADVCDAVVRDSEVPED